MSLQLKIHDLAIPNLQIVQRQCLSDSRGSFSRLYAEDELAAAGWNGSIKQINHSVTLGAGTIRGLHFQHPPLSEMKLVSCIEGCVWDVALDLRKGSPSFLQWQGCELSAENGQALLIPAGMAHGFQVISARATLIYLHSQPYSPGHDDGIHPQDPRVAIAWPQPIKLLSDKDRNRPFLAANFEGLTL